MAFVPLQVISSYSLLQSPITINKLVKAAKDRGYSTIALTDINVMYGLVNFYNAAKKAGIKPLLGLQISLPVGDIDDHRLHLILIAKNNDGYQSLMRISTKRQTKGALNIGDIKKDLSGLFVIFPPQKILDTLGNSDLANVVKAIQSSADTNSLRIGISSSTDTVHQRTLRKQAELLSAPLIAVEPVEYLNSDDLFATKVLRAVGHGSKVDDPEKMSKVVGNRFLRTASEMTTRFAAAGLSDAAKKTVDLANHCSVSLKFQPPVLPKYQTPNNESSATFLKKLCIEGLKKRTVANGFTIDDYRKRLGHELVTIHKMGFDDYFLIVWDVMNFAHRVKITTGPGRGSAAGSLVAYALAITDVDPLKYHLLFERFLNPERKQMPDIDLDIPDNRRNEVLQYVHDKYGHDHVGQIITFGTLAAKQVLRDVSRVFGLSNYQMNQLTSAMPSKPGITLKEALSSSQRLVNMLHDSTQLQILLKVALKLEGLPRHYSTHAAGVVLSDKPLVETVPLQMGSDGMLMTQFEKETVEAVGLLKMDFLGLKNLTIMDTTVKLIRQKHPDFSLKQVSFNDSATMKLFQHGKTEGVFQFESSGIRNVLIDLHPDNFELIVAVNALYRPGPMQNIDHFIARKKGKEAVTYLDPALKPILKPTFGILVYQEQVMQVASVMAGFSLGQADLLRRAMSKKKKATMESMREKFVAGAIKLGNTQKVAEQVFDYIDRFANYGFNRSHAVAYTKMAFEMAYLKCHYPAEFFTALLNSETNITKLRRHFSEAKTLGVSIKGPHVNFSSLHYLLEDNNTVRCGFSMIKGLRKDFGEQIVKEREKDGPYKDIRNFISRIGPRWQKEDLIESLIDVGAFDGLGFNRHEMVDALPDLIKGVQLSAGLELFNNDPTFQTVISPKKEYSLTERLSKEYDHLGLYLSGHPASSYKNLFTRLHAVLIDQINSGSEVTVIVFTSSIKEIYTKRDHRLMAFVNATDASGTIEMTAFPRIYARYSSLLKEKSVIVVRGKAEQREEHGIQLLISEAFDAAQMDNRLSPAIGQWFLRIDSQHENAAVLNQLAKCFKAHRGQQPVILVYAKTDKKILQPKTRYLAKGQATRSALVKILGKENVAFRLNKG